VIVPPIQVTVDVTPVVEIGSSGMAVEEQETPAPVASEPPVHASPEPEEIEQAAMPKVPLQQPQVTNDVPVRSQRVRRSTIHDDYEVYVSEDMSIDEDPASFEEIMSGPNSSEWYMRLWRMKSSL
jgi:hypothetical protein